MSKNHNQNQKPQPTKLEPQNDQAEAAPKAKPAPELVKRVLHCGMPINVMKDPESGSVDSTVFCMGCHDWVAVAKCEDAPAPAKGTA